MTGKDDLLQNILKRNRNANMYYSIIMMMLGLMLALDPWNLTGLGSIILMLVAGAITFSGLLILVRTLKNWNVEDDVVNHLIRKRPKEVVWVYYQILESMPFGVKTMDFTSVYIYLIDGNGERFSIKKSETDAVFEYLNICFPLATFGHSIEKEQLYRANPELLIRTPETSEDES